MKIKLSEGTSEYLLKRSSETWDRNRSHNYVPTIILQDRIQESVKEILSAQKKLSTMNRDTSIFAITSCIGSIQSLYESVCNLPSGDPVIKGATISDTLTVIDDDLCTRILVCAEYLGNIDFEPTNSQTIDILERISGMRTSGSNDYTYEASLISMFNVNRDISGQHFKMDKMQHICSAFNDLVCDRLYGKDSVEHIRLSGFITDIIYDIECLVPNILKDDKSSDIFTIFVDSVEDVLGINIATLEYYDDVNGTIGIADKLEFEINRLYNFFVNEVLVKRCSDSYGESYNSYLEIYQAIRNLVGVPIDNKLDDPLLDYSLLLLNVAYHMFSECLSTIWDYYIESHSEIDCFTYKVCRKTTLLTLYMTTKNTAYLNVIEEGVVV